ncbi:MAG TPA: ABC transporter ATP-binding protein [Thermoplasmata archaeon]|nr:ABC transporter ATP-binding protein [Thermoplasmata archaeon]
MPAEALVARELTKTYSIRGGPQVHALRGVSLTIHPGERFALLGRNGAGKTTFLRIASTLLVPTSGTVEVFGIDAIRRPEEVRPNLAVVPQEGKPFFHLTPREQVYAYLSARGFDRATARSRTEEALGQMGLGEVADRLSTTLSGGQRQRTMVATVIATEAPLLFLDEPTIGMDPFARRDVWESFRRLTRRGSTILLTTHYLDEAEHLSQRLAIVERGKVLLEGDAEGLKRQVGGSLRVSITEGARVRETLASFGELIEDGGSVSVILGPEKVPELLNFAMKEHLNASVGPVTLEEAFLRIVGHSINEES